jgi:hypothetical protein
MVVKYIAKEAIKKGKDLGIFQKIYKRLLKILPPKEAREAAKKAAQEAKDTVIDKKVAESAKVIKKTKKIAKIGAPLAVAGDVGTYSVTGESPVLGPIVKKVTGFKRGGEAKRKSSSSKKSRGTGAAIRGTKFKGVF